MLIFSFCYIINMIIFNNGSGWINPNWIIILIFVPIIFPDQVPVKTGNDNNKIAVTNTAYINKGIQFNNSPNII